MVQKILKNVFRQMTRYIDNNLSKHQSGYRKGSNTQYCLKKILEKWKSAVDKGKSFSPLLTNLSKAFDCLSHDLLLGKLHAYGFSLFVLKLIHSYLKNRKQRTKILGPLLFNIFLCDLFFSMNEAGFAGYADDSTC